MAAKTPPPCPSCGAAIPIEVAAAIVASGPRRKGPGPGRFAVDVDAPRCPCGAMTAKRAAARKHKCEAPKQQ